MTLHALPDLAPAADHSQQRRQGDDHDLARALSRAERQVVIPGYDRNVAAHFGAPAQPVPCDQPFADFGVAFRFASPTEIALYDERLVLASEIKELVTHFGVVLFANAYLPAAARARVQRNIFPSLAFHYDRTPAHANCYSLFTRDPFDEVQRAARTSSTLICSNRVGYLQALKEGAAPHDALFPRYDLFTGEDIPSLVGKILVEQEWSQPEGCGEICVFDNRCVLHASYYLAPEYKGYPIGVRYLF